jgi:hypothetical protein
VAGPTLAPPVGQANQSPDDQSSDQLRDQSPGTTGEKKFAQTMIIPPRDQGVRLSVPPIFGKIFGELHGKVVKPVGNVLRENGGWISLFIGLTALLVGVTVTAARHARRAIRDLPHASAPSENATTR